MSPATMMTLRRKSRVPKILLTFLVLAVIASAFTALLVYAEDHSKDGTPAEDPSGPELPDNIFLEGEAEFDVPMFWELTKDYDLTVYGNGGKAAYSPYPAVPSDSVLAGHWTLYSGMNLYTSDATGYAMTTQDSDDGTYQWVIKDYHSDTIYAYTGKFGIAGPYRPLPAGSAGVFIDAATATNMAVVDSWAVSYQFSISDIRSIEPPYWALRFSVPGDGDDYGRYMVPLSSMTIDSTSRISIYSDMASGEGRILSFSEVTTNIVSDGLTFIDLNGVAISGSDLAGKTFRSSPYSEDQSYEAFLQVADPEPDPVPEEPAEPEDGRDFNSILVLFLTIFVSMIIAASIVSSGRKG